MCLRWRKKKLSSKDSSQPIERCTSNVNQNAILSFTDSQSLTERQHCGQSQRLIASDEFNVNCEAQPEHYGFSIPKVRGEYIGDSSACLWKLPLDLSQSRFGGHTKLSSACTLIALKVAENMYRRRLIFPPAISESESLCSNNEKLICPLDIVNALVNAIVDGNCAYEQAVRKCSNNSAHNFNIPDALKALGSQFHEIQYCAMTGSMQHNLAVYLQAALDSSLLRHFKQLFFLLLAFERTILLVVQRFNNTIIAIDSHRHLNMGSYIARGQLSKLDEFIKCITDNFFNETTLLPSVFQSFELSVLQFNGQLDYEKDCPLDPKYALIHHKHNEAGVFPKVPQNMKVNHSYLKEALEALRQGNIRQLECLLHASNRMQGGSYRVI